MPDIEDKCYARVITRDEFEAAEEHDLGWYMAMARWKRWDRLSLGHPLETDDTMEIKHRLMSASLELLPIWVSALENVIDFDRGWAYGYVRCSLEKPDAEWQEVLDKALEGGVDIMLDAYFSGVPLHAVLGR